MFSFQGFIQILSGHPSNGMALPQQAQRLQVVSRGLQSQTTRGCQPKDWIFQARWTPSFRITPWPRRGLPLAKDKGTAFTIRPEVHW